MLQNPIPALKDTCFRWHELAALYLNDRPIARPGLSRGDAFHAIAAQPMQDALQGLVDAVVSMRSFCVSGSPLPANASADAGEFLTLTGGTTGAPKIVLRSQASWIASFRVNARLFALTPRDKVAVLGSPEHSLALYATLEGLHLGMDVHVLAGARPGAQRAAMAGQGITVLYATPTQLRLLTMGARGGLPNVRLILCGGGPLDPSTVWAAQQLCPKSKLQQFYGTAECSFVTLSDAETPGGSVGAPYPGVDIEVRDGVIWVRSPYLFKGYAAGTGAIRDEGGFVSIGEIGRQDPDGTLWLRGRQGRMVSIADQNVFPEEIEAFLLTQTEVQACAVLPIRDAGRAHRLVAVVPGVPDPAFAERLIRVCRMRFGALVAPQAVHFIDPWPQLASGKPDLVRLQGWSESQG